VLFNLVGNALKFTFHGFITITVFFENNNLVTVVKDTGIGIK
jgi:signal transduction histidine kinase